jgi:hypothetical protein
VGTLERYLGRNGASARTLEAAHALAEKSLSPDHPDRLNTTTELAITYLELGRAAEAVRLLEPVVAELERPGHIAVNVAESRFTLARALRRAKLAPERARALALEARAGYAALGDGMAGEVDEIDAWLRGK